MPRADLHHAVYSDLPILVVLTLQGEHAEMLANLEHGMVVHGLSDYEPLDFDTTDRSPNDDPRTPCRTWS